jgi:hypothetical protein
MSIRLGLGSVIVAILAIACGGAPSARALTMKECSAKYQAAQQAGTLNGMKWTDFRKAQCGSTPQSAAAPSAASKSSATAAPSKSSAAATPSKSSAAAAPTKTQAPVGNAVFPTAVSPKYSNESPSKARMHTCLDQYHTNKTNNANGGLLWIQKGGGYYSECSKRLKG